MQLFAVALLLVYSKRVGLRVRIHYLPSPPLLRVLPSETSNPQILLQVEQRYTPGPRNRLENIANIGG
jgi:hypothetical protein